MSGQDLEPNSFADFVERFWKLQEEAYSYGLETFLIVCEDDPIGQGETSKTQFKGSYHRTMGLLIAALDRFRAGNVDS